jgi:hypothetical protein
MVALPVGELFLQRIVGEGGAKVTLQCRHRLRLGIAIGAHDVEVALERDLIPPGCPDLAEVFQNLAALLLALFLGQAIG